MARQLQRYLTIPLQLAAVWLSLILAGIAAASLNIVPTSILPLSINSPLSDEDFQIVLRTFLIVHTTLILLSLALNKSFAFSSMRRLMNELHFILVSITLSIAYLFLFTLVTFSANYYLWAFVFGLGLYIPLFLVLGKVFAEDDTSYPTWFQQQDIAANLKYLFLSKWTIVTFFVLMIPASAAVLYKKNRDFADIVNYARVSINMDTQSHWVVENAYPGIFFDQPIELKYPDNRLDQFFLLERDGKLRRIQTTPEWADELVLDFSSRVGGTDIENGALSLEPHPEFFNETSESYGYMYVFYTHTAPGIQKNRLSRFDLSQPDLDSRLASELVLIEQGRRPSGFHNGGSLFFGPDGFLYLSIGELTEPDNHQRIDRSIAGGILRVDVDMQGGSISAPISKQPFEGATQGYFVPLDNPFYGMPDVLPEYWALGFRNPFRMSMDRQTGDIWLGDVGGDLIEEVNRVRIGDNGQYPYLEGLVRTPAEKPENVLGNELTPVYHYAHTSMERAVIGGVLYRATLHPSLTGKYIFADNQSGVLRALDPSDLSTEPQILARATKLGQQGLTSIVESPTGEIYITVLGSKQRQSGEILKLSRSTGQAVETVEVAAVTPESVGQKYEMFCSGCHGLDGSGMAATQTQTLSPNFADVAWQQDRSDERIREVIENGGTAMGLSAEMPAWKGVFTEEELSLLVRKIRSFSPQSN